MVRNSQIRDRHCRPQTHRLSRPRTCGMRKRCALYIASLLLTCYCPTSAQTWNSPGGADVPSPSQGSVAPAPHHDLSGIWDPGREGINGKGHEASALTAWGEQAMQTHKPGDGPKIVPIPEINDPLSTMGDPAGFPRLLLFEFRPFQIVQTSNQVLILYMFEKRWRVIWTDGRELPKDPDPRWYGYSVGRWEDDTTFVVETVG